MSALGAYRVGSLGALGERGLFHGLQIVARWQAKPHMDMIVVNIVVSNVRNSAVGEIDPVNLQHAIAADGVDHLLRELEQSRRGA